MSAGVPGLAAAMLSLAACGGGIAEDGTGDGGEASDVSQGGGGPIDGSLSIPTDGATPPSIDGGSEPYDAAIDASTGGGGYVDAGYYYGDGSYWVDGGAYPELDASSDEGANGESDAGAADAASGCGALSACCGSLSSASQSLCNTVVGSGDETNCSTELMQLQAESDCTGVTILATQIQVPANRIVSDGTTLFWTTFESSQGLLAMPVGGGAVTTLVSAQTNGEGTFLAVDDVNVYILEGSSLVRIPKDGSAPTLVNEPEAMVYAATSLGGVAYWVEYLPQSSGMIPQPIAIKSAPLQGDAVTTLATLVANSPDPDEIAVTSTTIFVGMEGATLSYFPMSGLPAGGATTVSGGACNSLSSDTDTIYCTETSGSNQAIASDGTATPIAQAVNSSYIVSDDSYVYWVDNTTVGTIMKAPKGGAGTATILARDTGPTAIAVDAHSVYWSDQEGYIKSVPK
jgi:hypothetical protein